MSYKVYNKRFESLVQPVRLYGARIWGLPKYKGLNPDRINRVYIS